MAGEIKKKSNPLLDLEIEDMVGGLAGQKVLLYGTNDTGKAIINSMKIPTPIGYRKVKDIKIGDYLWGRNGKPTKVLNVFPQGKKEVWKINFRDGRSIKCCKEHLWSVYNSHGKLVTLNTEEISKVINTGIRYSIPLCAPVQYEKKEYSIPPYVLGCLLGNGCLTGKILEYSSKDDSVPNKIAKIMGWKTKRNSECNCTYTFKKDEKQVKISDICIEECKELIGKYSYNKFIPAIYLEGNEEQRLDLLNGLLDTDGSMCKRGGITFSTTSELLREGIINLCYSLGMKADWTEDKREKYTNRCYNVFICPPLKYKNNLFTLDYHKERMIKWYNNSKKLNKNEKLFITSIENLGCEEEMTCFKVDSSDHLFLIKDYIVTHNTFQAMKCDRALLLMTESGGNGVRGYKKPVNSWADFINYVSLLTAPSTYEEMAKKFFTIVIDTAENLVDLCEQSVCKTFGVRDLSEIEGRANGYKIARRQFSTQINKLTSMGYFVIFIAHEELDEKHIDEITGENIPFIQPKGSGNEKSSMRMIRDICDFTIYTKPNGIDPDTNETIKSTGICKKTPHVFARSRYAMQTFIDPFTAKNMCDAMEKAIQKSAEDENIGLTTFSINENAHTKEDWIELIKPYILKLYKSFPEFVNDTVYSQLGTGRKVTSATDEEISSLESIYNTLVDFACDRGIVVEE